MTGDRSQIYIEAAHGLGEGVAVGNVLSEQFWFDKPTLRLARSSINEQTMQHAFDPIAGRVVLSALDPNIGGRPALDGAQATEVARLGRAIEAAFGKPMDVEWALSGAGEVLLLQARPETVWSNRPTTESIAPTTERSVTHGDLDPAKFYTTSNIGEAAPGGVVAPDLVGVGTRCRDRRPLRFHQVGSA